MAANVNAGDFENLRQVDRFRVATFREHDLGMEWVTKPWVAQHIKRSLHFIKTPWARDPCDAAMSKAPIGMGGQDLLRRVPALRSSNMPGNKSGEFGTSNVLRDPMARSPILLRSRAR